MSDVENKKNSDYAKKFVEWYKSLGKQKRTNIRYRMNLFEFLEVQYNAGKISKEAFNETKERLIDAMEEDDIYLKNIETEKTERSKGEDFKKSLRVDSNATRNQKGIITDDIAKTYINRDIEENHKRQGKKEIVTDDLEKIFRDLHSQEKQ